MMQHIKQINILDMMKMYGEDSCKAVLSTFMCPLNLDVEDFIQNKAVEFARQRIAITFLVFKERAFYGVHAIDRTAWQELQSEPATEYCRV